VPAPAGDGRTGKPRRARTDDGNPFWRRSRSIDELRFPSGTRIDETGGDFVLEDEGMSEEEGEDMPFALVVSRVDSLYTHTINGITLELARLAGEHGGRYDGWECPVTQGDARAH